MDDTARVMEKYLSTPGCAGFDPDDLIDRMMGDVDLARCVAQVFVESMPEDLLALSTAILASDLPAITMAAHSIKGAAANVGGTAVSEMAAKLEDSGKAGDVAAATQLLLELEATFQSLKPAIERFVEGD